MFRSYSESWRERVKGLRLFGEVSRRSKKLSFWN